MRTHYIRNRPFVVILALLAAVAESRAAEAPDMSGRELYRQFCASCHGAKAHGDGPVAQSLKSKVPDLTRIASRQGGAFPAESVRRTISGLDVRAAHGTHDMPVWGWEFYAYKGDDPARRKRVDELIARLVDYLASIQKVDAP